MMAVPNERRRKWKCVLSGRLREDALEATYAIAENLPERRLKDASLCQGKAGLAIFYVYLAETRSGCSDEKTALQFLHQAADAVAWHRMSPGFFGGFTGVAWMMEHLEGRLLESDGEDPNQAIDEALKVYLSLSPWPGDYDLVSGLVGFGIYALERLPRNSAIDCLKLAVDRLDEIAERSTEGVTWFTLPGLLPPHQRKDCPDGFYNVGLAHGVPGVIALLGQVCATSDKRLRATRAKARPLLDLAVAWLLAQQPADRTKSFPYWVGQRISATPTRLAWCYGDLGIAVALLRAARCVNEPAWEREALMIARRAAERPAEQSGVRDCGLCHGAAGVGHIFNRLFQATGEASLAAAARFWFERTLQMRRPKQGIAGFLALRPNPKPPNEKQWIGLPGILEGAAGIGLALLAATTPIEPKWDRMLMLSGGPR
jgi:lantibiotic modifying enzyme